MNLVDQRYIVLILYKIQAKIGGGYPAQHTYTQQQRQMNVNIGTFVGSDDKHIMMVEELTIYNVPDENTYKGLSLLAKVYENIKQYPHEDKYRHLKKSNAAVASMLQLTGAVELLVGTGFQQSPAGFDYIADVQDNHQIISKVHRTLASKVSQFEVVKVHDPEVAKEYNKRKLERQKELAYRESLVNQIKKDRTEYQAKQNAKKL